MPLPSLIRQQRIPPQTRKRHLSTSSFCLVFRLPLAVQVGGRPRRPVFAQKLRRGTRLRWTNSEFHSLSVVVAVVVHRTRKSVQCGVYVRLAHSLPLLGHLPTPHQLPSIQFPVSSFQFPVSSLKSPVSSLGSTGSIFVAIVVPIMAISSDCRRLRPLDG